VRGLWLDAIGLHRAPGLMAIEPQSRAWRAGQRGPERSGESWGAVLTPWPCWEHGIADGGQGLERGVTLAKAARGAQGEAAEPISRPAITMGLEVLHTQRARARVVPRPWKRAARGLGGGWTGVAPGRATPRAGGERPRGRAADSCRSVLV
jgi:hypothetical protein